MKHLFDVPVNVRGRVSYFAGLMERQLKLNDQKGGWSQCHPLWLLAKLNEEVGELGQRLNELYAPDGKRFSHPDEFIVETTQEAVDVANVAMMLFDVLSELIRH